MLLNAIALKLAGGALIVGSSTFAGFFYSGRGEKREAQLLEMLKALTLFKNEIRFQLTPLGEAAAAVSERVDSPAAEIFALCSRNALEKNGANAAQMWEEAVISMEDDTFYTSEDIQAFISMGKSLGILDKEAQSQSIDLLMEYISAAVSGIREKNPKESKMYKSLGFLGGLLVAVILI